GTNSAVAQLRALSTGNLVLVEFNRDVYGLYEYKGPNATVNLAQLSQYSNPSLWAEVTPHRQTDDGSNADVLNGQLVLSKLTVERVAMQLQDDVDVRVLGNIAIDSDSNVSVDSDTSLD